MVPIGGELYESVGVKAPILLSYTHKNEWNTHGGLPTLCHKSAMGVSLIFLGVRQQNGCFDTHTFIQFSTYGGAGAVPIIIFGRSCTSTIHIYLNKLVVTFIDAPGP